MLLFTSITFGTNCIKAQTNQLPEKPYLVGDYVNVYIPASDIYTGPTSKELEHGKFYKNWMVNDHSIIKGPEGNWHILGISKPILTQKRLKGGACQLFHAVSKNKTFEKSFKKGYWTDRTKVLPDSLRPNEPNIIIAPFLLKKDNLYYMVYGFSPIRLAVSKDLYNWEPKGPLFKEAKGARDPNLIFHNGVYYLSYCSEKKVLLRTSKDLYNWSEPKSIFESKTYEPESPYILYRKNNFYLFVCAWDGINHTNDLMGIFQDKTYVYTSKDINCFDSEKCISVLRSHAGEVVKDEKGNWYLSSVENPYRGVSFSKMYWKK